jgi:hypothetical protein
MVGTVTRRYHMNVKGNIGVRFIIGCSFLRDAIGGVFKNIFAPLYYWVCIFSITNGASIRLSSLWDHLK